MDIIRYVVFSKCPHIFCSNHDASFCYCQTPVLTYVPKLLWRFTVLSSLPFPILFHAFCSSEPSQRFKLLYDHNFHSPARKHGFNGFFQKHTFLFFFLAQVPQVGLVAAFKPEQLFKPLEHWNQLKQNL